MVSAGVNVRFVEIGERARLPENGGIVDRPEMGLEEVAMDREAGGFPTGAEAAEAIDRRAFLLAGGAAAAALPVAHGAGSMPQADQEAAGAKAALPGRTPHTTFALNIEMWFRSLPFTDRIRQTAALGFDWVEFWSWQGKDLAAIKATCEEVDVQVAQFIGWGFVPGLNHPDNHDQFEKTIEESCAAANDLGATMLTVVGGNDQPDMSQAEMHDHIITGLERVENIIESAKVMLILEPMNIRVDHKGHSLYGSDPAIAICRELDSPFIKINWDIYHMQITEGDLCRRIRDAYDQIGYIQIADNPGRREPGTGEINYTRVFQELASLGYDKPVGVECWPEGTEALAAQRLLKADTW